MELEHCFTVPAGIEQAWATLLDVEEVAPCMPGATLESVDGDAFTGKVKVKIGPITIVYAGQARFRDRDDAAHTIALEATGTETRGSGAANARVHATLHAEGASATKVIVRTDLSVTGRPAQFGRGVLNDVSDRLIGQFADSLAAKMATTRDEATVGALSTAPPQRTTPDAIDLVATAGVPVLKRLAPAVGVLAVMLIIWWLVRR